MRPIDADALVLKLCEQNNKPYPNSFNADFIEKRVWAEVLKRICEAPTLDYAPVVHGYWKHEEPVKDDGQKPFVCSTCGLRHPRYGDVDKTYFSHCPWCGTPMDATMDGGKKDGCL